MITPGERFNAFSTNRLIKKEENTIFGYNQKLILSPTKNAVFVFIHLLNRSITNIPWLFWISLIVTFVQLAVAVIHPFNENHWRDVDGMLGFNKVLSIIIRYKPITASETVSIIIFVIYCVLVIFHQVLFFVIVSLIKHKKDINILLKIFFFYSYLFQPLFRSSIVCVVSEQVTQIVRNPSFGSFFLSLFALIILLMQFFMTGFLQFVMGSSPSPNLVNPLAIWGPCAWWSVIFEIYCNLIFVYLEFIRSVDNNVVYAILNVILLLISIPHAIFQSITTYFISYAAYEYIAGILWAICAFTCVHFLICFIPDKLPFWLVILLWALFPVLLFVIMRTITVARLKKALRNLDQCGTPTTIVDDNNMDNYQQNNSITAPLLNDNQEEYGDERHSSVYDSLNLKNAAQAIFLTRAACVTNHPAFIDLSLLQYCIATFPSGMFSFLHLAFLVQNQHAFVQHLIDIFLESKNPGVLESCVIFQIITSMQESSNDLPQSLVRELGKQKLQAMKCQQLLSKFWTSCYKGDITQMSRHAYTLNRHINDISTNWKVLILRYPFSTPVLKDYIGFLNGIGTQHKIAEAILTNHPQLNDMNSQNFEQDLNTPILHQAVEDAVDRRPISSITKIRLSFVTAILLAVIFFVFVIVISFVFMSDYNTYNDFIYKSEYFASVFSSIPNFFDDVIFATDEYEPRLKIFYATENLENSLNDLLGKIPSDILNQSSRSSNPLFIQVDLYNNTENSDFVNTLRLVSYFARSLSFVPTSDSAASLVINNLIGTIDLFNSTMSNSIESIQNVVNNIKRYSPIFYVLNWVLLIVITIPLLYTSIKALKDEMTYIFSIYLTIPRSTITKFIEITGGKQQDKKAPNMFISQSFVPNAITTTTTLRDDEENENKPGGNVADSFKMLVNDSSSNISVLPKNFVLKTSLIFGIFCGIIAILSTIGAYLFISFSESLIEYYYTQKIVSDRTSGASIVMHAITSCGEDLDLNALIYIINSINELHTAILFKDSTLHLSSEALNDPVISAIQTSERCEDQSNYSCRSMISLYDLFTNQASNITSFFSNGTSFDRNANSFESLRRMYNDELYPLLSNVQDELYEFTKDSISFFQTEILIIIIVGLAATLIMTFFFVRPIVKEIDLSIEAVKLPLKHIPPVEIADLQKVLMYLQGESDFKRGGSNEKGNESQGGNSILNCMLCPFAIFEDDLSLLFANSAFYTLLGTSREAAIGLPLADIFASTIPFRNNESHPFNSLLDTVSQLQRGVSPVNVIEIRTELEINNHSPCPVMIRLVGICKSSNQQEDEEDGKQNLKASSYAVFVTDLSHKKVLEEKMKYEMEVSKKLMENTISKSLSAALWNGEGLEPKQFEFIPMVVFTIKYNHNDEESEDDLMIAYSLFLRTANDVNQNFSKSITKLIQDPPKWFYISGYENTAPRTPTNSSLVTAPANNTSSTASILDEMSYSIVELCHFALSIIDVYNASSSTKYGLCAIVHVGQLSLVPLQLALPTIEPLGIGYMKLKSLIPLAKPGTVLVTSDVEGIIGNRRSFTLSKENEPKNDPLFSLKRNVEQIKDDTF